ncbi:MAG TPA: DNA polymerase IV [Steroidobacteraceae bacterium]
MQTDRAILHVDMDAFYASIEQRDNPHLRGKPVIVGGTCGRGVVAAASYEVRKYGVHSAMPMRTALRLCPHAKCVPPRMAHYKEVSQQIFAIFHQFTPLVEGLSLDEAFLDVTASQKLMGPASEIARLIKSRILETTQLTASVGVAPNKLVAKIASDLKKPDGLTIVPPDRVHEVLDPLSVRRLPGLGRKMGARVEALGIQTLGQLRAAPDSVLRPLFGRYTQRVRDRASGIDDRPVVPDNTEQSISAEETFDTDIAEHTRMHSELVQLADRTCTRLRARGLVAGCVTVKIRRDDFSTYTRQRRISPSTNETRTISRVARELLSEWLKEQPRARLRLLGVGVSQLSLAEQLDLFASGRDKASALDDTVDAIRKRFGPRAVRRAGYD